MKTTYVIKHWDARWKYYCIGACWRASPKNARRYASEEKAGLVANSIGLTYVIEPYQAATIEKGNHSA